MDALGIDFKLFLGQIINFLILLFILWRFAYKPILKMLNDRRGKVAESLENAKKIEENLAISEQKTREILSKAQTEAERQIENAKKLAIEQKNEIVTAAKTQAEKEVEKAKIAISAERVSAEKSLESKITQLVALATGKILEKETSAATQNQAIDEAIEELK